MGTRTQHTKTDLSRVLRGRCWLRNTRYSQLALGAAARLLCSRVCESGSVATARPCQRTGPSSSLRPNIFLLSCARFRELFSAVVVPKQRSVLGTVAPRVCCLQLVPQRRRPAALRARCRAAFPAFAESRKAADIGRRSIFFFVDFERIRFSAGLSRDASLGGARFFVFFFFFVLLSEDTHRRSPHVAVGVTRRLTLRKCLASSASHR